MTSINTNLSSLIVQKNLTKSTSALNQAIERLTTGFKINHASDNAANYSISESMSSKLSSYFVAEENTSMGLDLIQTQSSTLDTIQNLTTRLRALAEQAHNGTYGAQSLAAINQEADAIISEIERIGNNAEYNGIKLFDNALSQAGIPQLKSNGLMQEIERRDTSGMTKLADVAEVEELAAGTYSISSAEELVKLATMQNAGNITEGSEFVLGADIDLSGIEWESIGVGEVFNGTFDGNGYTISNLSGTKGLFGNTENATIKNVILTDCNISGSGSIGGLVGNSFKRLTINNCSVYGNISSTGSAGLIVGHTHSPGSPIINIENCYSSGNVSASNAGGIAGNIDSVLTSNINNCFSSANVTGSFAGGIVGRSNSFSISNSAFWGNVAGKYAGGIAGSYESTMTAAMDISMDNVVCCGMIEANAEGGFIGNIIGQIYVEGNNKVSVQGYCDSFLSGVIDTIGENADGVTVNINDTASSLQVGIDSSDSSKIGFTTNMSLSSIASLRGGMEGKYSLENIDSFISKLSEAQTKLGAIENRLTSTLESISVNVENLTSSRSTLKDADVAKESSQLLKNQILQQAAATLLSTANQTPTFALRLLNGM